MRNVRLIVRATLLALTTFVLWVVLMLGWPVAALFGRAAVWPAHMTGVWSACLTRILGLRVEVVGDPPPRGVLLVANHLSYVDIVLIAARLPCSFVSKSEVAGWPVVGFLARLVGTLFIERDKRRDVRRVGDLIRARLTAKRTVVVFPEGTSTNGEGVAPFRSSLLEPAAALGIPVYHATIRYEAPPGETAARDSVAWWGDTDFVPHFLGLLRMSGFSARIVFGADPVQESDRKSLARSLHSAVASRFIPMPPGEDVCLTSRTSPASS